MMFFLKKNIVHHKCMHVLPCTNKITTTCSETAGERFETEAMLHLFDCFLLFCAFL